MFIMSRENVIDLPPVIVFPDEAKRVLLRVIEQAVRDFINYQNPTTIWEQEYFTTAKGFLFDDDYRVSWGDWECSLQDLLDIFDIEASWLRKNILSKLLPTP